MALAICAQKLLLGRASLRTVGLWGSYLRSPLRTAPVKYTSSDARHRELVLPERHPEIPHFPHFRVSEAHSFLVSTREIIIHPTAYGQQVFYPFALAIGIIPCDNMVLTKNIKTRRLKFLVLVHNVA